jgi:RimJ/RimL family protein N-acetyltransferase
LEQAEVWYDRSANAEHAMWFTVYAVEGWRPIGYANLRDVDFQHRTATFVLTIGEPADRGKGYGTEATRLLMDHAFLALGLHNLWLDVFAFNEAGRRAYEKAGFREIGRRREAHAAGGRQWDVILMDALASEFDSPVLRRAFQDGRPSTQ